MGKNLDIVIKKADKGSVVVIMDKKNYITELYHQLNNCNQYEKVKWLIKITGILNKLKSAGAISVKQFNFLLPPQEPRPRYLYMLPKIHRGQLLDNIKRNTTRKANCVWM